MTKQKADWGEVEVFILNKMKDYNFNIAQLRTIIKDVLPFSWRKYCWENNLNEELRRR